MGAYAIRRTAALALAALALAACGLFEPAPLSTERPLALTPEPTPSAASPAPSPTPGLDVPTPSPSPSPSPREIRFVPALPDDDEDDLRRIFEDLVVGTYELGVTPDPGEPGGELLQDERDLAEHAPVAGDPPGVVGVRTRHPRAARARR